MRDGAELLIDEPLARRGRRMLEALAACMPPGSVVTKGYGGRHRLLVVYGVGLAQRLKVANRHREAGGHVAMWDMGYWDREEAMRLSVDSFHPTVEQIALAPAEGARREFALREDATDEGPVLVVGIGDKSARMYGLQPMEWERAAMKLVQRRWPERELLWRPKGKRAPAIKGAKLMHGMPIDEALRGCSLVVCRHSNVSVDACVAGIPVRCDDGAARAIYTGETAPSREQRAEFLRRLSFWNWRPAEASQAWEWILKASEQCQRT